MAVGLFRRIKDIPRVIGPHTGKLHVVSVLRLEESLLKRFVQTGLAVIPVPVPDQYIDTALFAEFVVDLPCRGFTLVQFAQQRCTRLLVSFIPRTSAADEVILSPSRSVDPVMKRRGVVIGKGVTRNGQSFGLLKQRRITCNGFEVPGQRLLTLLWLSRQDRHGVE